MVFQLNFSCFIAFLSEFVSILSTCITIDLLFVSVFPAIVSCMFIFTLSAEFPKILYTLPHQNDVYPASMFDGSVNRVCVCVSK